MLVEIVILFTRRLFVAHIIGLDIGEFVNYILNSKLRLSFLIILNNVSVIFYYII